MTFLNVPPAFDWPVQFCAVVTALCYVISIITSNVSQVDRVWTFLPTIYTAYYALLPLLPTQQTFFLAPYAPKSLGYSVLRDFSPRAILMLTLTVAWMLRLSYNTYRRGLFSLWVLYQPLRQLIMLINHYDMHRKDEDYRWAVLRSQVPAWFFHFINLIFIAVIQNVLLLILGIPAFIATVLQSHADLSTSDYVLAFTAFSILTFEFTADNQQFAFQTYKHAYLAHSKGQKNIEPYMEKKQWPLARLEWTPSDARRGFVTKGLWRFSRHPNFACEQSFWARTDVLL
jgi:steroid 5-alpha reductase family enzyme